MREIKQIFDKRLAELEEIRDRAEQELRIAPEGKLRINRNRKSVQYYHRQIRGDKNGAYIPAANKELAGKLAQKNYDEKILKASDQEMQAIAAYLTKCPSVLPEKIYDHLSAERKELVIPFYETDDMIVEKWQSVQYKGKPFKEDDPVFHTDRGERVRSKSEVIIANAMNAKGRPYRYEYPLDIGGRRFYPDFTILNLRERKVIYWDHFGMMSDPEYARKAVWKIQFYQRHGFFPGDNLICTFETRDQPLDPGLVRQMIDRFL